MIPPLVKTLEVPCAPQRAFEVFVQMDTWWPLARFSVSALRGESAVGLRVEPRLGGQIVEVGPGDLEHFWGSFTAYEPHDFLAMDFHIGTERGETGSTVEVRFDALDGDRTLVVLTQTNWEALGDIAEMMRGGYGKGWDVILIEGYAAACK